LKIKKPIMKKTLLFTLLFLSKIAFAQTNIAVPSYSSITNTFAYTTGLVKFYLDGGTTSTFTVGHGANGVVFFQDNMFVAYDDGIGTGNGILWYKGVSLATGSFTHTGLQILVNDQKTFSLSVDLIGNLYTANADGTVTRFNKQITGPFYTSANKTTQTFWTTGSNAKASGVYVDNARGVLWAVSYDNNQVGGCKLSSFGTSGTSKFFDNTISGLDKPEGISIDKSGNLWLANNANNKVTRIYKSDLDFFASQLFANNYTMIGAIYRNYTFLNGHQLGGLVFDDLFSKNMFVNDQLSGGASSVIMFEGNGLYPSFNYSTTYSQIYPGAGQAAIIPCALLPPVTSMPITSNVTILPGQSATLSASGCAAGDSYSWFLGANTAATNVASGNNATYTTFPTNSDGAYTVYCKRNLCPGPGATANITVTGVVNAPIITSQNPPCRTVSNTYIATGCTGGTLKWNTYPLEVEIASPSPYTFTVPSSAQSFWATCTIGAVTSDRTFIPIGFPVTISPNVSAFPSTTISSGESVMLTAIGCNASNEIVWNTGARGPNLVVSPVNISNTYTASCANAGCLGNATSITINVTGGIVPIPVISALPTSICEGFSSNLTATNCPGVVTWSTSPVITGTSIFVSPNSTQSYTATCTLAATTSAASLPVTVTIIPSPVFSLNATKPILTNFVGSFIYLPTGQSVTLSATGCTGTLSWNSNAGVSSGTTLTINAPLAAENFTNFINVSCTSSTSCVAYKVIGILNQFATDDIVSVNKNTFVTFNVKTNDTQSNFPYPYIDTNPSHGTLVWQQSFGKPTGVVTYTPTIGYIGTDSFTYYLSDDLTNSAPATVSITVVDCLGTLIVNGINPAPPYAANKLLQASNQVIIDGGDNAVNITGANSNKLTVRAGNSITINKNTSIGSGAVFKAEIGGCQ
jgi:Bacterial Ig domain